MRHYTEIKTRAEMEALLARVAGFHDSMTKEVHIANRGWVGADRSMIMSHRFDVRMLVQSQWDLGAIELLFIGVEQLSTGSPAEYWGASGEVEHLTAPVDKRRIQIKFDSALTITAERLFFVDRPSWVGPQTRFGGEVPHPESVAATRIDDSWWQCSSCSDAFNVQGAVAYSLCPGCGSMTEIVDDAAQQSD